MTTLSREKTISFFQKVAFTANAFSFWPHYSEESDRSYSDEVSLPYRLNTFLAWDVLPTCFLADSLDEITRTIAEIEESTPPLDIVLSYGMCLNWLANCNDVIPLLEAKFPGLKLMRDPNNKDHLRYMADQVTDPEWKSLFDSYNEEEE